MNVSRSSRLPSVKAEPEFVICHNGDDVEIADDPFALYDTSIEIKTESDTKEEKEIFSTIDISDIAKDEVNNALADDDADYGSIYNGGYMDDDADEKPFVTTSRYVDVIVNDLKTEDMPPQTSLHESEVDVDARKQQIKAETVESEAADADSRPNNTTERSSLRRGRPRKPSNRQFQCFECDKLFKFQSQLKLHLNTHSGEKMFPCPVCGKLFSRPQHYKTHMTMVHGNDNTLKDIVASEPTKKCEVCNKVFRHAGNYRTHMKIHTGERDFKCTLCEKTFRLLQHLKSHVKLTHTDDKFFQCNICGRMFNHAGNHKKHMRTVCGGERPFKCDQCDKSFGQSSNLRAHMRVHMGDKPFKCNVCDRSFIQLVNLTKHLRIHTGEKPFKCNMCDRHFRLMEQCREHMRVHTGEKPYSCTICNKSFTRRNHYGSHKKTHHNNVSFECKQCDQKFKSEKGYKSHLRSHEKRTYRCTVCEELFTTAAFMVQHRERLHPEQPTYKCSYCSKIFIKKSRFMAHISNKCRKKISQMNVDLMRIELMEDDDDTGFVKRKLS